ncbi:phage major tail tube protein [Chelatococcus asaccharovorans]|uniref:P2 family phage contractile tail tube protein n=1 Tax=Chelatococcus asaccharovorans TaxID=28210 RepID=A0A2V3UAX1_9HYPH|nr:phage major tail tube protein [Chelatococcus asaccharovorans]MBS7703329.1 phage major tail tube protein [Chelatococcus asaccharovorans]PXW61663.1 P2 family phage contractile tail tube protein [Chelatococcus asaccharovorans]
MRDVLHNMSVFIDGVGRIGDAATVRPPVLTMHIEDFMGGGMNTPLPVHLGTEKLGAEIEMNGVHRQSFALFGLAPGVIKPFTIHGALASSDGTKIGITMHMRGFIEEIDEGDWVNQEIAKTNIKLALNYYRRLEEGVEKLEIDVLLGTIKTDGIDQTQWMKDRLYL